MSDNKAGHTRRITNLDEKKALELVTMDLHYPRGRGRCRTLRTNRAKTIQAFAING